MESRTALQAIRLPDGVYVRASDVTHLLHQLAAQWRAQAQNVPPSADPRRVADLAADALERQAVEVDFHVLTQASTP